MRIDLTSAYERHRGPLKEDLEIGGFSYLNVKILLSGFKGERERERDRIQKIFGLRNLKKNFQYMLRVTAFGGLPFIPYLKRTKYVSFMNLLCNN